jgi:hypothetical protein
MAATGFSLWTSVEHGVDDVTLATVIVMVVAFVKTRFVGMHFMELRHAPFPLRMIFHGWYTVSCAAVLGVYLLG